MNYEAELSRWTTKVFAVLCWSLLLFVVLLLFLLVFCWSFFLFVVTENVTRTRASISRRMGYITGTGTMEAELSRRAT